MDHLPLALTDGDGRFSSVSQLFGGDDKVSGVGMLGSCLDECVVGWSGDQGALVLVLDVLVFHSVFSWSVDYGAYSIELFLIWFISSSLCIRFCSFGCISCFISVWGGSGLWLVFTRVGKDIFF